MKKAATLAYFLVILLSMLHVIPILQICAQDAKVFFTLTAYCVPTSANILEYYQSHLEQIGIGLEIQTLEWVSMRELVMGTNAPYEDGGWDFILDYLPKKDIDPDYSLYFESTSSGAYHHWDNAISDRLIRDGRQVSDIEERQSIYNEWQRLIYEEEPIITLFTQDLVQVHSPGIQGVDEMRDWAIIHGDPTFRSIFATWPGHTELISADYFFGSPYFIGIFPASYCTRSYQTPLVQAWPNFTIGKAGLADTWELSEDQLSWTFHLVEDAVWSDGVPITSKDVKFTYEAIMDPDSGAMLNGKYTDAIESIETPDNHTVTIHLKEPNAAVLAYFAEPRSDIIPEHILKDIALEDWMACDANTQAGVLPSSGPYICIEKVAGEYLVFEPNDSWFGWGRYGFPADPPFQRVVHKKIPEAATALAAVEAGEVHIAGVYYRYMPQVPEIEANPDLEWNMQMHFQSWMVFWCNCEHPILNNQYVRKAMSHAFPREQFVQDVWNGIGVPTSLIYLEQSVYYDDSIQPNPVEYDLEKAREYMTKAGYDYAWLEASSPPYIEYVGILIIGSVIGAVVGIVATRRRKEI
jgi:ABC-type transport system substrate-binding protein